MNSKYRLIFLVVLPALLVVAWLFLIDYSDFFSKNNLAAFFGITAMAGIGIGNAFQNKKENGE